MLYKGFKHSEETKQKMRASAFWRGKHLLEETKRKLSIALTGKCSWNKGIRQWEGKTHPRLGIKHTAEARQKISTALKGKKREPCSDERKRNISLAKIGKKYAPRSAEAKKKTAELQSARLKGKMPKNILLLHTKEVIKKRKEMQLLAIGGDKSWFWKGGITPSYKLRRRENLRKNGGEHNYKEWEGLKIKYNYTCPACLKKEPEISLTKDHIIPVLHGGGDGIENIQPLCVRCNSLKREKTIKYEYV